MFFSSVFIYVIQLCEHSSVWPALFNRSAGSILRCLMLLSVIFFVIVYFSSGTLFTRYFICFRADLMTHLLFWHKFRDDEGIYGEESLFKLNSKGFFPINPLCHQFGSPNPERIGEAKIFLFKIE